MLPIPSPMTEVDRGEEFEDVRDMTPPKGLASAEFMVETWRESNRAKRAANGARRCAETAAAHALDACEGVGRLSSEVSALHAEVRKVTGLASIRPPMPPMRAEASSSHNLQALEERAIAALNEGIRAPGKQPDEEVRKIFAEEAENARLRRVDKDAEARSARVWRVVETVAGGLALAGAIELWKWVASLHH